MHSQNGNSDLGACSQVAVFVFDFILCVQRTHSTAVNEINVERPPVPFFRLSLNSLWVWEACFIADTHTMNKLPGLN